MRQGRHALLDDLAAWHLGGGEPKQAAELEAHVNTCAHCTEMLLWLQGVIDTARADHLVTPPRETVERAVAIFKHPRPESTGVPRVLRRLSGQLMFDTATSPRLAHARGSATDRQMLYEIAEVGLEIDLLVQRDASHSNLVHITGQAMTMDVKAGTPVLKRVSVRDENGAEVVGVIHATGEFSVEFRKDGSHTLLVWTEQEEIVLPVMEP